MILSMLNLVGGTAVGSQAYDSIYGDQSRENMTAPAGSGGGECPITADCVGVPGGDTGSGPGTSSWLLDRMDGFHGDGKTPKPNTLTPNQKPKTPTPQPNP
jgi:hypothetical protein